MQHDLAVSNYSALRAIGFNPERASYYAAQWADYHVSMVGHRFDNGRLFARLSPEGGDEYELELHLGGREAA
jgi:hypothetical protein